MLENSILYIVFSYFGCYFINYDLNFQDTVSQVRQEGLGKAKTYFDDHKVIYRDFKRWPIKQDSISNQK